MVLLTTVEGGLRGVIPIALFYRGLLLSHAPFLTSNSNMTLSDPLIEQNEGTIWHRREGWSRTCLMSILILPINLGYVFMFRELSQLHFGVAFLVVLLILIIEVEGFKGERLVELCVCGSLLCSDGRDYV